MSKPVILTGLRANNDLQIGNYFGAIMPMVKMAQEKAGEYQVNIFVPDLHSFTTPIDHSQLQDQIMNNLRLFVAAGMPLDNPDVHIYRQSYIPAHSELTWILSCFAGFGELGRMTEFKDKSVRVGKERIGVGQFTYPVLQAADILLYNTTYVPVGEDQRQHIEFSRDIAQRMNTHFGEIFTIPASMKEVGEFMGDVAPLRIMDLQDPSKKMSKSDESGKGVIFLGDDPEVARKKVMSATTDSVGKINYDPDNQPGLANLLDLYELFGGSKDEFIGHEQYGPLKTALADKVPSFLAEFQKTYQHVDMTELENKLASSEKAMNVTANNTLLRVQQAVGLRPRG